VRIGAQWIQVGAGGGTSLSARHPNHPIAASFVAETSPGSHGVLRMQVDVQGAGVHNCAGGGAAARSPALLVKSASMVGNLFESSWQLTAENSGIDSLAHATHAKVDA
jgi:hypothetical protein